MVDQSLSYILPSHRKINEAQTVEIDLADDSEIKPKLAYELTSRRVGGQPNLGYLQQDHKNYLRTKRKNDLKHGEVGSILNYFHSKVMDNPSFSLSCKQMRMIKSLISFGLMLKWWWTMIVLVMYCSLILYTKLTKIVAHLERLLD